MLLDEAVEYAMTCHTPFFLFDLSSIREHYSALRDAFPAAYIHYAVKANNHPTVLSYLRDLGARFEVGSLPEIGLLEQSGVSPGHIIFSSPVKPAVHIREAFRFGIDLFVYDSENEIEKLSRFAPGSRVMVRIVVPSDGSLFPLNAKFGALPEKAVDLLLAARSKGLSPYGIAFHVGSQCERKETWREALEIVSDVWRRAAGRGIILPALDIGGGFPLAYAHPVPGIEEIAREIRSGLLAGFPPETELMLEPGRFLVGGAAILAAEVIGVTRRESCEWAYLNISAFHGLIESLQMEGRFPYQVTTGLPDADTRKYVLSGNTCDPDDTLFSEIYLPELSEGDRIFILNTGAYSFVYATQFHAYPLPRIYFTWIPLELQFEDRIARRGSYGGAGKGRVCQR
jgi:ornithine decarboxylase